jgi:hypothetical protein
MGFHGVKDCNGRKKKFMKIKRKQIFTVGSNMAIKRIRPIGGGFGHPQNLLPSSCGVAPHPQTGLMPNGKIFNF